MAFDFDATMGSDDGASCCIDFNGYRMRFFQTVQGLVHNYGGLLGMRWMLG